MTSTICSILNGIYTFKYWVNQMNLIFL